MPIMSVVIGDLMSLWEAWVAHTTRETRTKVMDAQNYLNALIPFPSVSRVSNVEVSRFVHAALDRLGFDSEFLTYTDAHGFEKANVIARKGAGSGGFAYFCHTDVVPADDWYFTDHGPFEPTLKDSRIYGRGSCDMKGSLACMLASVERFRNQSPKSPVYIVCTSDEEVGFHGARYVAEHSSIYRDIAAGNAHGIIGEPTSLQVVHAHKGVYGFKATSHGKSAHSSTREGLNANLAMIPFLVEMKAIHDETEASADWQNTEFDPPTLTWNIGINDHTKAVNIKPAQSICTVYFRPMPGHKPEELLQRVRQKAEQQGLELEVTVQAGPMYVDPNSTYIQQLCELAGCQTSKTVSYGTDGTMFSDLKNLAVCGPGSIAQAHTYDEWIAIEQLQKGTDLYSKFLQQWCFDE